MGIRLEQLFASSDYRYHLSQGGKLNYEDFIRYHDVPEKDEPDLMAVAKMFGAPVHIRTPKKPEGK